MKGNVEMLEVKRLNKHFGKKVAVKDVDFQLKEGSIVGLVGPNGSGKTTIMKMLVGIAKPTSGEIYVNERIASQKNNEVFSLVGGIIENPALYPNLSGEDNLKMKAILYPDVTKERIIEVINLLGLENRIKDKVKTYSLGMKQRLGIAMATLNRPQYLVLDEPMNGLDPLGMKELSEVLIHLKDNENICILISSHLLKQLEEVVEKVIFIKSAEIVYSCDLKENDVIDLENKYLELMGDNVID